MADRHNNWMPFWLASYIFFIGFIALQAAGSMFCIWAYENDIEYVWQIGITMCATVALPWVWYFTYLAHRYLNSVPRLCYLWIFIPFILYTYRVLERETLYSDIFTLDGVTYFINIGREVIILPAIAAVVWYEIHNHRAKYINSLHRAQETTNV